MHTIYAICECTRNEEKYSHQSRSYLEEATVSIFSIFPNRALMLT